MVFDLLKESKLARFSEKNKEDSWKKENKSFPLIKCSIRAVEDE